MLARAPESLVAPPELRLRLSLCMPGYSAQPSKTDLVYCSAEHAPSDESGTSDSGGSDSDSGDDGDDECGG